MIIWGSKGKEKTIDQGQFFCPNCGTLRPYRHKKIARYFTLYFIPIFETKKLGEYIECQVCFKSYKTEILQYSQSLEKEKANQQQIQNLINLISEQLDSGISVQAMASAIKNTGANEEGISAALYAATKGKIKYCNNCQIAYKSTLTFCSLCGSPLSLEKPN